MSIKSQNKTLILLHSVFSIAFTIGIVEIYLLAVEKISLELAVSLIIIFSIAALYFYYRLIKEVCQTIKFGEASLEITNGYGTIGGILEGNIIIPHKFNEKLHSEIILSFIEELPSYGEVAPKINILWQRTIDTEKYTYKKNRIDYADALLNEKIDLLASKNGSLLIINPAERNIRHGIGFAIMSLLLACFSVIFFSIINGPGESSSSLDFILIFFPDVKHLFDNLMFTIAASIFSIFSVILFFIALKFLFVSQAIEICPDKLIFQKKIAGIGSSIILTKHNVKDFKITEGFGNKERNYCNIAAITTDNKKYTILSTLKDELNANIILQYIKGKAGFSK